MYDHNVCHCSGQTESTLPSLKSKEPNMEVLHFSEQIIIFKYGHGSDSIDRVMVTNVKMVRRPY